MLLRFDESVSQRNNLLSSGRQSGHGLASSQCNLKPLSTLIFDVTRRGCVIISQDTFNIGCARTVSEFSYKWVIQNRQAQWKSTPRDGANRKLQKSLLSRRPGGNSRRLTVSRKINVRLEIYREHPIPPPCATGIVSKVERRNARIPPPLSFLPKET